MLDKFEVHIFNHFGAISFNTKNLRGHVTYTMALFVFVSLVMDKWSI